MARIVNPLTDTKVNKAKPLDKSYKLFDGGGLYIEIMPNGSKLWRIKYSFHGKEKRISLGAYPTISLALAREKKEDIKRMLLNGNDPSINKKIEKSGALDNSFSKIAIEWFELNRPRWAIATQKKVDDYFKKDIIPSLGKYDIKIIKRADLIDLIRKIENRNAFDVAKKTRQWLNHIFRYAIAKDLIDANPATDLDVVAMVKPESSHYPFIDFSEIPIFLRDIQKSSSHALTKAAIYLLILTAVRPGELRFSKWDEFDLEAGLWEIPKERMKMRRSHITPLSNQAISVLKEIYQISSSYQYVFAGSGNITKPISENTVNRCIKVSGYEKRQTGHGFRHLLSTELNNRGYNHDWIEKQLAHGDTDKIRGTYNHASYLEPRKEMMQEWADSIDFDFKIFS